MTQTILIIDPDELIMMTLQRALSQFGYSVVAALNGKDGLEMARLYRPELIVLDIDMPGMTGYEVCRTIRKDPLISETPILFLTARKEDEDEVEALMAGADDYMTKPFNMEVLHLRIRAILRRTDR